MSGIIRPKKSYEEQRREFNIKRGLQHPPDPVLRDEPASPPAPEPAAHPVEKPRQPAADRKPRQARSPRAPRPVAESTAAVLVKLRVPAPKPGTFPLFDKAVASMGEKRALQRLLSKSLSDLTLAVERGEKISPASYPTGKASLNTTKMLNPVLYATAKAALDPLDLETPGGLGRAISMAALARYLEKGPPLPAQGATEESEDPTGGEG